jgi:excisionase family DNA binding protein
MNQNQSNKKYSVFDYTVTLSRKHRYLVVGSPEFGFQIASTCLDLGQASAENIGKAVLRVLGNISYRLQELNLSGESHPEPLKHYRLLSRDVVSASEVIKILGVSRPTLRRMVSTGRLKAQKTPGGHLRFSLDAISEYLGSPAA